MKSEEFFSNNNLKNEKMDIKLSKKQIAYLQHICKKGFGAYSQEVPELDEMVASGLLEKNPIGPFGEIGYRPTEKGRDFVSSIKSLFNY